MIQDLAEGRDGRMYFLVVLGNGNAALDRYDPVRLVLERLPLQTQGLGRFTLAAGKDGLFFAPWDGQKGRWKIAWEALEDAAWTEVEGATINGIAPEEGQAGREE